MLNYTIINFIIINYTIINIKIHAIYRVYFQKKIFALITLTENKYRCIFSIFDFITIYNNYYNLFHLKIQFRIHAFIKLAFANKKKIHFATFLFFAICNINFNNKKNVFHFCL